MLLTSILVGINAVLTWWQALDIQGLAGDYLTIRAVVLPVAVFKALQGSLRGSSPRNRSRRLVRLLRVLSWGNLSIETAKGQKAELNGASLPVATSSEFGRGCVKTISLFFSVGNRSTRIIFANGLPL